MNTMLQDKTFTLADVLDSIEKNGLPQITGSYFSYPEPEENEDGEIQYPDGDIAQVDLKVLGACAMGMACVNLGVTEPEDWDGESVNNDEGDWWTVIRDKIIALNDDHHLSFKEIVERIRDEYPSYLDKKIKARGFQYNLSD